MSNILLNELDKELTKRGHGSRAPLAPPVVDKVRATGESGQAKARVDRKLLTTGWEQIMAEYAIDGGLTWIVCYQQRRTVIVIDDLPNTNVQLRFYVRGSGMRTSGYSTIFELGIA